MSKRFTHLMSAFLLIAILLAACTTATTEAPSPTQAPVQEQPTQTTLPEEPIEDPQGEGIMLPEVDPADLSGDIIAAGSSTVYPLTEAMANLFISEGFSGKITIDSIGTGAGFERFCSTGETDISNASRPIKDEEAANCQAIGREAIEFRVGTDALAVVVSQENDFLQDVTIDELAKIFSNEVTKWNEVRAEWPDQDILRFSPGTDSGTFDYFVEAVMDEVYNSADGAGKNAILNAVNIQFSEDDNVLVQGVEGSPYAIGYFGYAYLAENEDVIRAISVEGVAPTAETAESGEYSLSRPLFIYSDAKIMQEKPQVASFVNYFLTYVNDEILDAGYFPASQDALDTAKQAWLDAVGQ